MKATALEFRLRVWIIAGLCVLGFYAPWQMAFAHLLHVAPHTTLWQWVPTLAAGSGIVGFSAAAAAMNVLALLLAGFGAWMRVWGTAYLGSATVNDARMQASAVAAGPYRYVRNPLYLGLELGLSAVAVLMPVTGAVFAVAALAIFQYRLILGEEAFLSGKLGEPYRAYLAAVPRIVPTLRPRVSKSGVTARWGQAVVAELFFVGVFAGFVVLSWQYNPRLMMQMVIVCFGLSLVVKAFVPRAKGED